MEPEIFEKLASDVINRILEKLAEDMSAQYGQINNRNSINNFNAGKKMLATTGGMAETSVYTGNKHYENFMKTKNMGQGSGTPRYSFSNVPGEVNPGGWNKQPKGGTSGNGQFSVPQSTPGENGQYGVNTYQTNSVGTKGTGARKQGQPTGQSTGQYQVPTGTNKYQDRPRMTFQSSEMPSQGIASKMFNWFSGQSGAQGNGAKQQPAGGGMFNWFRGK